MSGDQQNEFKSKSGLKRIFLALGYSLDGLAAAWKHEHAFRQELVLFAVGTLVALWLPVAPRDKLALIGALVMVLIVELLNSAIEAVVDRVSPEPHPLSKNAKDFGSAAVLLALLLAGGVWLVILWPVFFG